MDINFERKLEEVREVSQNRKYWFIRTYSGEIYSNFIREKYIGIGLNNVPLKYIEDGHKDYNGFYKLKEFIAENTHYKKGEATKAANQLIDFQYKIEIGDIVVIPSENSSRLAIGEVVGPVYMVQKTETFKFHNRFENYPEKRRRVNWITSKDRSDFQGELKSMLNTRQAVTPINNYAEVIEGHISSLFIKEERMHLVIEVNKDEEINAFVLNKFLTSLTYFYHEFCIENDIEHNEDLTIKIKVQSRGKMALAGLGLAGVLGVGTLIAVSNNPELSMEIQGMKLHGKSDGFFNSVNDFLDRNQERRIRFEEFKDSMQQLQAKRPVPEPVSEEDTASKVKTNREEQDAQKKGEK